MTEQVLTLPATFTRPLAEDFVSDGPKLRRFAELFWKTEDGKPFHLDEWQAWLIDRALERYPDDHPDPKLAGQLRYRQCVISVARQNGKSVFAALFGLYGLLFHVPGPMVVGLASSVEQANIIYKRVRYVIDNSDELRARFRTTGTRGITRLDKPGHYMMKPAKSDALQGIATSLCLFDEVHICPPEMWDAMLKGTTSFASGLVLGITTAGDDESELLKRLYKLGEQAAAGDPNLERFGFFCWEAPEGAEIDNPDALRAANPAIGAGRLDLDILTDQVRTTPQLDALRYTHNRFVAASGAWIPMGDWLKCGSREEIPAVRPIAFTIDQTPTHNFASITASWKDDEGRIYTRLVASLVDPHISRLADLCQELHARHTPEAFVMDGYNLGKLAEELRLRGLPVKVFRQADTIQACAFAYRQIVTGKVVHPHDPLVNEQMGRAVRKNIGDQWRISRNDSSTDIDAVMATVLGIWAAETVKPLPVQVF